MYSLIIVLTISTFSHVISSPLFLNLDASVQISSSLGVGDVAFAFQTNDDEHIFVSMTTASNFFEVDISNNKQLLVKSCLTPGEEHILNFIATDQNAASTSGTLTLNTIETAPIFNNLPMTISLDLAAENNGYQALYILDISNGCSTSINSFCDVASSQQILIVGDELRAKNNELNAEQVFYITLTCNNNGLDATATLAVYVGITPPSTTQPTATTTTMSTTILTTTTQPTTLSKTTTQSTTISTTTTTLPTTTSTTTTTQPATSTSTTTTTTLPTTSSSTTTQSTTSSLTTTITQPTTSSSTTTTTTKPSTSSSTTTTTTLPTTSLSTITTTQPTTSSLTTTITQPKTSSSTTTTTTQPTTPLSTTTKPTTSSLTTTITETTTSSLRTTTNTKPTTSSSTTTTTTQPTTSSLTTTTTQPTASSFTTTKTQPTVKSTTTSTTHHSTTSTTKIAQPTTTSTFITSQNFTSFTTTTLTLYFGLEAASKSEDSSKSASNFEELASLSLIPFVFAAGGGLIFLMRKLRGCRGQKVQAARNGRRQSEQDSESEFNIVDESVPIETSQPPRSQQFHSHPIQQVGRTLTPVERRNSISFV